MMKITAKLFTLCMIFLTSCATLATEQPLPTPKPITIVPSATATLSPPHATPTLTLTPFNTLEPAQVTQTLQPFIKEPMNCAVPCFWGIIPGKTQFDEVKAFFSKLGFTSFQGTNEEGQFYTISYDSSESDPSYVTFHIQNNLVENIEINPRISESKEGSLHEWTAYSPETLVKRYGKPSHVQFGVTLQDIIGIGMDMYFDDWDLIVSYSGYLTDPESFCPPTASFFATRLWIGPNPPDAPSLHPLLYKVVPLEDATSLTIDQFTKLMLGDPKKACFKVKLKAFEQ